MGAMDITHPHHVPAARAPDRRDLGLPFDLGRLAGAATWSLVACGGTGTSTHTGNVTDSYLATLDVAIPT
jgi:hypothetical protein